MNENYLKITEKEMKFDVKTNFPIDEFIGNLIKEKEIRCKFLSENSYIDTYFDSIDGILFLAGFGCRQRVIASGSNKKSILEVKSQPKRHELIFFSRNEWKLSEEDGEIFNPIEAAAAFIDFFNNEFEFTILKEIKHIIEIRSKRKKWILHYKNTTFELSYDDSKAYSQVYSNEVKPFCFAEIEIELLNDKKEEIPFFVETIKLILKNIKAIPSAKNKLEKSLSHFNINFRKIKKPDYKNTDLTHEVFSKIIRYYFDSALQNENGVKIGLDVEFVHDMRVAIRKLRTVLQCFKYSMTGRDLQYFGNNYKWIADFLGSVRDIDVYISKFRAFIIDKNSEKDSALNSIEENILKIRGMNRKRMISHLKSKRYFHFLDRMAALLSSEIVRKDNLSISFQTIEEISIKILKSAAGDILKSGKRLLKKLEEEPVNFTNTRLKFYNNDNLIHKLRIKFKRLRYILEFFNPIFNDKIRNIALFLPAVQDELGNFVDTFFLKDFTVQLIKSANNSNSFTSSLAVLYELRQNIVNSSIELRKNIKEMLAAFFNSETWLFFWEVLAQK